jgi:hypothetical protein
MNLLHRRHPHSHAPRGCRVAGLDVAALADTGVLQAAALSAANSLTWKRTSWELLRTCVHSGCEKDAT